MQPILQAQAAATSTSKTPLAVNQHTFVVAKVAELVRLDFMFLGFVVVHVAFTGTLSPRAFYHTLFTQKIGGLNGIRLVGGTENHPVAKIQGQDF